MSTIAAKLIAGVIGLALLVAAFFYVRELRAELADKAHQLEQARQAVVDRDHTIDGLREDAKDKAQQQLQLDVSTQKIATKLATARQEIRKVINENPTVRTWADTPLPDDVARLSASPAYTGADDFASTVSADKPLHAASDGAAH